LPKLAVIVTAWAVETADTFAVKLPLVEFRGIVTVAGTATAALLLDKLTICAFAADALDSFTVQISVPAPVMVPV
jgi:hypothetical protein